MNRWQDISISDASLKAEFITKFFDGDYIDAFTIISNNPQLNTKAFVANTINQIATILLSLENNFQNGVIDYLAQQYSNFQNIIDNYNLRGNWSASTTYQIYNFVTYNNIDYLYINLIPSSGNLPTNTDYWVEINIQGEKGAPGLGVNLQYNWSATTPYNALDVVYYNNALWVARVDNINKIPGSTEEWETLSGAIVSFYNDGDIEISNLTVAVEHVQDLHGYDAPWPAGGGVNKLEPYAIPDNTSYGVAYTNNADGSITISGVVSTKSWNYIAAKFPLSKYGLSPGASISVLISGADTQFAARFFDGATLLSGNIVAKNVSQSFDTAIASWVVPADATSIELLVYCTSTVPDVGDTFDKTVYPMLAVGSTAPTAWTPYENICPISGHDSVEVEAAGENLLDPSIDAFQESWSYLWQKDIIPAGVEANMAFSDKDTSVDVSGCYLGFVYDDLSLTQSSPAYFRWIVTNGALSINKSNLSTPGALLCRSVFVYPKKAATLNKLFSRWNISVQLGSTASAYKPYTGNHYTIQLGQTVYGGTLDVTAGKMYTRPYFPSYNGQTLIGPWVSSMDAYTPGASPTVGAQVVDMGGAVTEITLDPVTISTISGQTNNVWADAGDVAVELDKKYWEEFIKFKLASIYTDYIEPSVGNLYNGLIWFEVFNPQNWSYLTNRNYTWNQINTNNDTWESVDRGDY